MKRSLLLAFFLSSLSSFSLSVQADDACEAGRDSYLLILVYGHIPSNDLVMHRF